MFYFDRLFSSLIILFLFLASIMNFTIKFLEKREIKKPWAYGKHVHAINTNFEDIFWIA